MENIVCTLLLKKTLDTSEKWSLMLVTWCVPYIAQHCSQGPRTWPNLKSLEINRNLKVKVYQYQITPLCYFKMTEEGSTDES